MRLLRAASVAAMACLFLLPLAHAANTFIVDIAPNNQLIFKDRLNGTPTTTIAVGDTVQWVWQGSNHSTTSGTCSGSTCTPDHNWDSAVQNSPFSFSHVFKQSGTFPYFCIIHGGFFGMRGTVIVNAPDYTLSISNSSVAVLAGQTATFNGNLTTQGFTNAVSLTCIAGATAPPPNCAANPSTEVPPGSFTITADTVRPAQMYHFSVQSVGTGAVHATQTVPVALTVQDFTMGAPSRGAFALLPSQSSGPDTFNLTSVNGFMGDVTLSCSGLPAGANCLFPQNPVQVGPSISGGISSAAYSVTTSNTPAGSYTVTINATSPNALPNSQTFTLQVEDFALAVSNPLVSAFPNQTATFNGQLSELGGYNEQATISCEDSGSGLPTTCTPPGASILANSAFNIQASGATAKDYVFNVLGVGPDPAMTTTVSHRQAVTLRVIDFTLGAITTSPINVVQGNPTAPLSFTLTGLGQGAPTIHLSCGGLPTGATCSFSPSSSLVVAGGTSVPVTLVVNTGSAAIGTTTVTVSAAAQGAVTPKTQTFQLMINAGAGSVNLKILLDHAANPKPDPIPVGKSVLLHANITNVAGPSALANLLLTFSAPVTLASPVTGCSMSAGNILCSSGATPADFFVPVVVPFTRNLKVSAWVSSTISAETDPTDNTASDTVKVRPRPFARNGLPPQGP